MTCIAKNNHVNVMTNCKWVSWIVFIYQKTAENQLLLNFIFLLFLEELMAIGFATGSEKFKILSVKLLIENVSIENWLPKAKRNFSLLWWCQICVWCCFILSTSRQSFATFRLVKLRDIIIKTKISVRCSCGWSDEAQNFFYPRSTRKSLAIIYDIAYASTYRLSCNTISRNAFPGRP